MPDACHAIPVDSLGFKKCLFPLEYLYLKYTQGQQQMHAFKVGCFPI